MTDPKHKRFQAMLQPYVFVLQEGAEIQSNPFDYKLRMLHTNCREVIKVLVSDQFSSQITDNIDSCRAGE